MLNNNLGNICNYVHTNYYEIFYRTLCGLRKTEYRSAEDTNNQADMVSLYTIFNNFTIFWSLIKFLYC